MKFCIYNTESKQILFEIEDTDPIRIPYTREAIRLQAMVQGPGWYPYSGETAFCFPVDNGS
jgi:hypothetical protein